MNRIKEFIHEIHRRSLWQVLGIFLASSWGVLQAVEFVTDLAGLPDWTPAMALVLLMIGLPICLATAFVQEGLPGKDGRGEAIEVGDPGHAQASTVGVREVQDESHVDLATAGPGQGTRQLLTWRNAIVGGIGAFALLGFSLIAYFVMWTTGIGPVGNLVAQGILDERDPVILAEFENRTADETLGAVVTDALRVDLLESQVVTLMDDQLVSETLQRMGRDPAEPVTGQVAREVATRDGIKAVIEGDVSRVGTGYLLSVEIVSPADGTSLAAFRETAEDDGRLLPAIDRLSQKLRERAGESLRDIRAGEPLEEVTTSSLDALRLYSEAERALDQGEVASGLRLLEDAVAVDSTFAMAWRKLAVTYGNMGGSQEQEIEAASAAYRFRDRLTERERYLAEAYYHNSVTLDFEARADAYRRVLEIQPDDATALNNLGIHYYDRRDYERARDLYVRAIDGVGTSRNAFNNLVSTLYSLGEKEAALEVLDQGEELYPLDPLMRVRRIRILWGLGRHQEAVEAGRAVMAAFPDATLTQIGILGEMGAIEASRGRLEAARMVEGERRSLAARADRPGSVFAAETSLGSLDLASGADTVTVVRRLEARFDEIFANVPAANRPYGDVAGMWAGMVGDPDRARVWADRALGALPPEAAGSPFYEEIVLTIEGFLGLAEGDYRVTIESLQEVARRQNDCEVCFLDVFADAHEGLGEPDSAAVYLERFLALDEMNSVWAREVSAADRLEQLARLYEAIGRDADAAETWTRFADRWADADPVLQPRVRAARANAERLSGSPSP